MDIATVSKPSNWPQNNREINLENIYNCFQLFLKEPNYKNKELLFSLLNVTDINSINEMGLVHICDYEIALINELYLLATMHNCVSLKSYLYGHIARYTQLHKMLYNMNAFIGSDVGVEIKEYFWLTIQLKLFYACYADFNRRKDRNFADSIIDTIKDVFYKTSDNKIKADICYGYNMLLYDLSFVDSNVLCPYLKFDRLELKRLFELSADLNKSLHNNITERPLKGIIKLSLRQWVLKSRNNYDMAFLYKSISVKNALKAFQNHQVWMSKTQKLNDKREQKTVRELFNKKTWLSYDWAKKVNIDELNDCYVCSFTKIMPDEKMRKKYGDTTLGYKTDRIADIISPIVLRNKIPMFDSVACYDVLYDKEKFKEEINFLCQVINLYDLNDEQKSSFFNEIMQYWYFSIKDKKWESEQERRYQLFIFDYKEYIDLDIENDFLKIKSSLYLYPDFILTDNGAIKSRIKFNLESKRNALASRKYAYCETCCQADFTEGCKSSISYKKCPICGSEKITIRKSAD